MMKNDTISRQAAIDALTHFTNLSWDKLKIVYPMLTVIEELPSAGRHGRWIRTGEDGYCSVCKCDMPMFRNDWEWEYTETHYCPNCGARMEGER